MRVAYLIGRYPGITHTFILREVRALRRLGVEVQCYSVWRTAQRDLLSPVDWEEWRKTESLLPPQPARLLRAHLRALRRAPRPYVATLGRALALSSPGIRGRLLGIAWFVEALVLWDACRQRGVTHIHAHLDGTAPMVAMLAADFGAQNSRASGPGSWSQTIHGSKEFYEVHRERLAIKAESAEFIACISDYTRSQVMAFVPEELWHKLVVVRCGVDLDEFARACRRASRVWRSAHPDSGAYRCHEGHRAVAARTGGVEVSEGLRPKLTVVGDGASKEKAMRMSASASASAIRCTGRERSARTGSGSSTQSATCSAFRASPKAFRSC